MAQPTDDTRAGPLKAPALVVVFGTWALLALLARQMPPDGHERGNLGQFLGRLHPLLVHGPVALLALVPFMELLGRRPGRAALRSAAGWILAVAVVAVYVAAFDGWLLAWSGGYRGQDVTRHMWGAVMLAGVGAGAYAARRARARFAYPLLLAGSFGLMVWTGHGGGAVSHGHDFLTERMPVRLRQWLGLPPQASAPAAAASPAETALRAGPGSVDPANRAFYGVHVAPLLARSCVSCHRAEKHKGELRLDSYQQLMRGGEDGPVVVPGDPKSSDLMRRLRLPLSDDDSMPSDGDKPLTLEEIQMIDHWIAAGAKGG